METLKLIQSNVTYFFKMLMQDAYCIKYILARENFRGDD